MSTSFSLLPCILILCATLLGSPTAKAALNPQEQELAKLLINSGGQNRPFLTVDPTLSSVARERAADMARRGYFGHVNPDGDGANWLIVDAGYPLPSQYLGSRSQNNVESIAGGRPSASSTWSDWMGSSGHRTHLLAEQDFYESQTSFGVGYHYDPNSKYVHYWCVLTAPPGGPRLTVTAPGANARVRTPLVDIAGTTSGAPAAQVVQYRVENASGVSAYLPAVGTGSWRASVANLLPGKNVIQIRSLGAGGAVLEQSKRAVDYVVFEPLAVTTAGEGTIPVGFTGTTSRELGKQYTITATAASGWLFTGWSGSLSKEKPTLTFTMRSGLQLVANFAPNPFPAVRGGYTGLVQGTPATHASSGFLRAKLTSLGTFSGKLLLGGESYPITGGFDLGGNATVTIPRSGATPLTLQLHVDLTNGSDEITGTVSDGVITASVKTNRALPVGSAAVPFAGRYTISLPAVQAGAGSPRGNGYATMKVTATGAARIDGALADGVAFTQTTTIAADGTLPFYTALYGRRGSISGVAQLRDSGAADLDGALHWSRPARAAAPIYPEALELDTPVIGSRYVPPAPNTPVVVVTDAKNNATLSLSEGDLEQPIIQPATLDNSNRVLVPASALSGLKVTIDPANGRFVGKFIHPVSGATHRLRGVIFQKQNAGFGYFLGVDESGSTSLAPAE